MKLDHLVWASPSLDDAMAAFADMSGVEPMAGGRHMGLGSRNAVAALGPDVYLAIDGPDETQPLEGNYGARLKALPGAVLSRFAVQTDDLAAAQKVLADHGYTSEVKPGGRSGANGQTYSWESLAVSDTSLGAGMPLIKTWLTPDHPSAEAPAGCRLIALTVAHPEADKLRAFYDALGLDLPVVDGSAPALTAEVEGPKGRFVIAAG